MALVSIIIPVFNVESYLGDCINSILNQSFNDFEVILIDDGSTDLSGKMCDQYSLADNRIIVIHQDNQGVSIARNNGIKLSKGKYIMFVDADDYISKYAIESHIYVYKNNNSDVTMSGYCIRPDQLASNINFYMSIQTYSCSFMFEKMLSGDGSDGYLWNKMFKSDIIKKNNLQFREGIKVWEDMLFLMEYYMHSNSISIFPDVLYYYRQRSDSAVNTLNISKEIDKLKVLQLIYTLPYQKTDVFYKYIDNIFISLYSNIVNRKKMLEDEEHNQLKSISKVMLPLVSFVNLSFRNRISYLRLKLRIL